MIGATDPTTAIILGALMVLTIVADAIIYTMLARTTRKALHTADEALRMAARHHAHAQTLERKLEAYKQALDNLTKK